MAVFTWLPPSDADGAGLPIYGIFSLSQGSMDSLISPWWITNSDT